MAPRGPSRIAIGSRDNTLAVEGLYDLMRDLGRADKDVEKALKKEFRGLANIVRNEARSIIRSKMSKRSNNLFRKVNISVARNGAYVYDTAKSKKGYYYPAVLEWGGSRTRMSHGSERAVRNRSGVGQALMAARAADPSLPGYLGPFAFLEPALINKRQQIEDEFEQILGRFLADHGF